MTLKLSLLFVIGIFIIGIWITVAEYRTDKLSALSDCVAQTALSEGFTGNPFSAEAWDLFAPVCNK